MISKTSAKSFAGIFSTLPNTLLFSFLFLLGAALGFLLSLLNVELPIASGDIIGVSDDPGFLRILFCDAKFLLAALFLAFTLPGFFLIPALFPVCGFFLAYSVAIASRIFGADYPFAVISAFLPSSLLLVPGLYFLSLHAVSASRYVSAGVFKGRARAFQPFTRSFMKTAIFAFSLCLISALYRAFLLPRILLSLYPILF